MPLVHDVLDTFFNPASVAIIGASADAGKAGNQILRNMIRLGYAGQVYPVNPKLEGVLGLKCYPSLRAIPGRVELMVIAVPAERVPDVFEEARERGDVKAAVVLSAGFAETREPERIALEGRLRATAAAAGIRFLGPNCVGVMNTATHLDTTFAPNITQVPGGMGVLTQSGSLGAAILMFSGDQPVPMGFSKWAHVGNMGDVDLLEILRYYRRDPETKVIAAYMEGIDNAREFMDTAAEISRDKPVIVLKVGKTALGSTAANSHTGSLAGSDAVYDGALRQAGAVRVCSVEELLDAAKALSMQPLPKGGRISILTEAGGPGIIAMDAFCEAGQGSLAALSDETVAALKGILPPMAIIDRPGGYIDMSAAAGEEQQAAALDALLGDPGVDGVVFLSVPPTFLDPVDMGKRLIAVAGRHAKPVLSCVMAGEWVRECRQAMEQAGLPTYDMPDRAALAMSAMIRRATSLAALHERERSRPAGAADARIERAEAAGAAAGIVPATGAPSIADIIRRARDLGPTEVLARRLLEVSGLDTGRWVLAKTKDEVLAAGADIGYPVVLKVVSPLIVHKSDAGGVRVGLGSPAELAAAFDEMGPAVRAAVGAAAGGAAGGAIEGFLVCPQAPPGVEVIIGATRDSQMGPMVMFGMGGVLTEVYKDVVFRMAPVDRPTAEEMIASVRSASTLLGGFRGSAAADTGPLAELIVGLSRVFAATPDMRDLELNPVRVRPGGLDVLDARFVLA